MMRKISMILGAAAGFAAAVWFQCLPVQAQVSVQAANGALAESAGDVIDLVRSLAEEEAGYKSPRSLETVYDEEGVPVSVVFSETVYDAEGRRLFYGRRSRDLTPSEEEEGNCLVRTYAWGEEGDLPAIREVILTLEEGKKLSASQIEEMPEEEAPGVPSFDEEGRITAIDKDEYRLEIRYGKEGGLQRVVGLEDGDEVYRAAFAVPDSGVPTQCQTEEHLEDGEVRYTLWMFSFDDRGQLVRADAYDEDRASDQPVRTVVWEVCDAEEEENAPTGYVQHSRYRNGKLAGTEVAQVENGRTVSRKLYAWDGKALAGQAEKKTENKKAQLSCGDVMETSSFTDGDLTFAWAVIDRQPSVWFAGNSVMEINGTGTLLWYMPSDFRHFGSVLLDTPYGKALFRDLSAALSPEDSDGKYFVLQTGERTIVSVPYTEGFAESSQEVTVTVFGGEELLDVSDVPETFSLEEGAAAEILEEARKAYEAGEASLLQKPLDWPSEAEDTAEEEPEAVEVKEEEAEKEEEEASEEAAEKTAEEAGEKTAATAEEKLAEAAKEGVAIASTAHYPDAESAAYAFLEALSGVEEERLGAYCTKEGIDDWGFSDMYKDALDKAPKENREELESLIHRALRFEAKVTETREVGGTTEVYVTLHSWDFDKVMDSAIGKTTRKVLLRYGFKAGSAPTNELVSIFVEAAGEALDE